MRAIFDRPMILTFREVGDGRLPEERQHVVLAHRVELDVAHDDHLRCAFGIEDGVVHDVIEGRGVAAREEVHCLRDAQGRAYETFPIGVLADLHELFTDEPLEPWRVDVLDIVEVLHGPHGIGCAESDGHVGSHLRRVGRHDVRDLEGRLPRRWVYPARRDLCDRNGHVGLRQYVRVRD
jgi:hypothetical protein